MFRFEFGWLGRDDFFMKWWQSNRIACQEHQWSTGTTKFATSGNIYIGWARHTSGTYKKEDFNFKVRLMR
jgi:hypothetical protein